MVKTIILMSMILTGSGVSADSPINVYTADEAKDLRIKPVGQMPLDTDSVASGAAPLAVPPLAGAVTAARPRVSILELADSSSIEVYLPQDSVAGSLRQAVIICPGGGYGMKAIYHEGRQFADYLAGIGVIGVVLDYNLPEGNPERVLTSLRLAYEQMCRMSDLWQMDTAKVGVMGFSAGGHLASMARKAAGADSLFPAFSILFYPVINFDKGMGHEGSVSGFLGENRSEERRREYSVLYQDLAEVPTLIMLSDDDRTVPAATNGLMLYDKLRKAGCRPALCVFPSGGHGWGFNDSFQYHDTVLSMLKDWFK